MNKHKKWVLNSVICLKMLYIITEGSVSNLFFFFLFFIAQNKYMGFPNWKISRTWCQGTLSWDIYHNSAVSVTLKM